MFRCMSQSFIAWIGSIFLKDEAKNCTYFTECAPLHTLYSSSLLGLCLGLQLLTQSFTYIFWTFFSSDHMHHPRFHCADNIKLPQSAESIEWFLEGQAFLRSYDSAPCPPTSPFPPSREQVVSLSQFSSVSPVELTDGRRGGGLGEEPKIGPRESLALYK
jgi:hypothetical protein